MAGVAAANKCTAQGWDVAIVDSPPYGGTCALRGCDPKKILRRGAEIIDSARLMRGKGIDDADLVLSESQAGTRAGSRSRSLSALSPQTGIDAAKKRAVIFGNGQVPETYVAIDNVAQLCVRMAT